MGCYHYDYQHNMDGARTVNISQCTPCIVIAMHASLYTFILVWKRNKDRIIFYNSSFATCLWSRSYNITKHDARQTAQNCTLPGNQNYFLPNTAVKPWHYACPLAHFTTKACYTAEVALLISPIHCLLCSLPYQRMCRNLSVNIQVHLSVAAIVIGIKIVVLI